MRFLRPALLVTIASACAGGPATQVAPGGGALPDTGTPAATDASDDVETDDDTDPEGDTDPAQATDTDTDLRPAGPTDMDTDLTASPTDTDTDLLTAGPTDTDTDLLTAGPTDTDTDLTASPTDTDTDVVVAGPTDTDTDTDTDVAIAGPTDTGLPETSVDTAEDTTNTDSTWWGLYPSGGTGRPPDTGPSGGTGPTDPTDDSDDTDPVDTISPWDTDPPVAPPPEPVCTLPLRTGQIHDDAWFTRVGRSPYTSFGRDVLVHDVDGDGAEDLVVESWRDLHLAVGPLGPTDDDARASDFTLTRTTDHWPMPGLGAADLDGDGFDELYVPGKTLRTEIPFVHVVGRGHWGRHRIDGAASWGPSGRSGDEVVAQVWEDGHGPGRDILALGNRAQGKVRYTPRRPLGPAEVMPPPILKSTRPGRLGDPMVDLGDPDGDGAPEWAVASNHMLQVLDAGTLALGPPHNVLARVRLDVPVSRLDTRAFADDLDGDGILDLIVSTRAYWAPCHSGTGGPDRTETDLRWPARVPVLDTVAHSGFQGCVPGALPGVVDTVLFVFHGPLRGDLTTADAAARIVVDDRYWHPPTVLTPGDVDGDGVADLLVWRMVVFGPAAYSWRLELISGPFSGDQRPPHGLWVVEVLDEPGRSLIADPDADGQPDVVAATQGRRLDPLGAVRVWPLCPP